MGFLYLSAQMQNNDFVKNLVSVVVPVYNREALVADCVRSALAQTYANLEVVIVDNASTDTTWAVCEKLESEDPRVRIFRNSQNLGPVRNWIRGVNEAKGEYTKILFSDDLIYPRYLEASLELLRQPELGFVFSALHTGSSPENASKTSLWKGRPSGTYSSHEYHIEAFFGGDIPVSPGAALFRTKDLRKNILLDVPGPRIRDWPDHGGGVDFLTYLLAANSYDRVGFISEPLAFFRSHPGSITSSEKVLHLADCYRQARVWAASLKGDDSLGKIIAYLWLLECARQKHFIDFKKFVGNYCLDPLPECRLGYLAFAIFRLLTHGLWSMRQRLFHFARIRS
jgi:glycosyltransferase involved in cell wall biosynthesis